MSSGGIERLCLFDEVLQQIVGLEGIEPPNPLRSTVFETAPSTNRTPSTQRCARNYRAFRAFRALCASALLRCPAAHLSSVPRLVDWATRRRVRAGTRPRRALATSGSNLDRTTRFTCGIPTLLLSNSSKCTPRGARNRRPGYSPYARRSKSPYPPPVAHSPKQCHC